MATPKFDFSSARAKLWRAKRHLDEANRIYEDFIKDDPYTIFKDVDGDGRHRIGVATLKTWPPELALVLGDAANCLRATLDHIAFACVTGSPNSKQEKSIEFPILETIQQFDSAKGTLSKWLSPAALPLFERFQPGPNPQYPGARHLAILREVNNRDKHRALSIISGLAKRVHFTATPAEAVGLEFPDGRLEVGAILVRFQLREGVRREDVKVHCLVTIVPVFGDGMPQIAVGQSAVAALSLAYNFIRTEIFPAFSKL